MINALLNRRAAASAAAKRAPARRDIFQAGSSYASTLEALLAAIGEELAARLIADLGGSRMYIALSPYSVDRIARSIGAQGAAALRRVFGGDRIQIPIDPERALRRAKIVSMRRRHRSITAIARAVHCSERYVYRILADARQK